MRVGMFLPTFDASAPIDPPKLRRMAVAAEAGGLDHLFVGDHFVWNVGILAPMATLAYLASVTDRIQLGIGVYLLPLRHPVIAAKDAATVDVLSNGRLILGLGAGGENPTEYEALGLSPGRRGPRLEESLTALRSLLAGEHHQVAGYFGTIPSVTLSPPPTRRVPLWMGGRAEAVIDRAARLGDGWFPVWVSARRYGEARQRILEKREPHRFSFALNVFVALSDSRERARADAIRNMERAYHLDFSKFERYVAYGTAADILEFLEPYRRAGVTDIVLNLTGPDHETQQQALLAEVVPSLRGDPVRGAGQRSD